MVVMINVPLCEHPAPAEPAELPAAVPSMPPFARHAASAAAQRQLLQQLPPALHCLLPAQHCLSCQSCVTMRSNAR